MAQILVRNLEDDVKEKLRARAKSYGLSTEELVRDILRAAAIQPEPKEGLGTRIAKRFAKYNLKEEEIPELRGYPV